MTDSVQIRSPVWERQDFETDEHWGTFLHYRNSPPLVRSMDRTAAECFVSFRVVEKYAEEMRWQWRTAEYDKHVDSLATEETAHSVVLYRIREERLATLKLFGQAIHEEIEVLRMQQSDRRMKGGKYSLLKPHEMARFLRDTILLERLLMGESTENVSVRDGKLDRLSDAELEALDIIEKKLTGKSDDA